MKFLIIDGSSLFFRAFYALPLLKTKKGIYTNAIYGFVMMLENAIERIQPDYLAVCFDMKGGSFRKELYSEYKGTRQKTPNELEQQFPLVREILKHMNISVLESPVYEADDIAGTLSLEASKEGMETYLLTGDKDYFQLVDEKTKVLLTRKGITEMEIYSVESIQNDYGISPEQFIDLKGLMGDNSDNIPGVPGVGEKTGLKLIQEFSTMENLYDHLDEVSGKKLKEKLAENKVQAFMSKKLGTIVRNVPLDVTIAQLQRQPYHYEQLSELYRQFEFHTILARLPKEYQKEEVEPIEEDFTSYEEISVEQLKEQIAQEKSFAFSFLSDGQIYEGVLPLYLAIKVKNHTAVIYPFEENLISQLRDIFEDETVEKLGHDLKSDILILQFYGVDIKNIIHDSMIAEYILNSTQSNYEVDFLSKTYFSAGYKDEETLLGKGVKKKKYADLSPEEISAYLSFLLNTVYRLQSVQMEQIEERQMQDLYFQVELPLEEVLASMELEGIRTDVHVLDEIAETLKEKIDALEAAIYKEAQEEFNINSPKQLGVILFEKMDFPVIKKTKTGYSTSADVLEKLQGKGKIIDDILEYRKLTKLQSTYIDGLKALINPKTGHIHSHFNQTVTSTGRISSTEPNLQNIPIRTEEGRLIRKALLSSVNRLLVDADYSQIELRVLANLSKDEAMLSAFKSKLDIHRKTASEVFHVPYEEVTSDMRSKAKAVNFGIVYGISDYGLSQNLNIPRKEAASYIENYLHHFEGIKNYMSEGVKKGREQGYVETILHRRRYIPELSAKNFNIRSFGERVALNTPIQGSAADIIKIAMVKVYQELKKKKMKSKLILQIHDELIVDATMDEVEDVKTLMKELMESAVVMEVPFEIEMNTGNSLYETK